MSGPSFISFSTSSSVFVNSVKNVFPDFVHGRYHRSRTQLLDVRLLCNVSAQLAVILDIEMNVARKPKALVR